MYAPQRQKEFFYLLNYNRTKERIYPLKTFLKKYDFPIDRVKNICYIVGGSNEPLIHFSTSNNKGVKKIMKKYTIENGFICYDGKEVYALDRQQNAKVICECVQNVHLYLLENADISLLSKDRSVFDLFIFSCTTDDFPYIKDAFAELNHTLKTEPDEDDYFIIDDNPYLTPCNGDVLVKWDMKTHSYKCYDMSALDLKDLHDLLVFG